MFNYLALMFASGVVAALFFDILFLAAVSLVLLIFGLALTLMTYNSWLVLDTIVGVYAMQASYLTMGIAFEFWFERQRRTEKEPHYPTRSVTETVGRNWRSRQHDGVAVQTGPSLDLTLLALTC